MERRLNLTATLTTAGTVTPPIGPVPPDTAAALESAIRTFGVCAYSPSEPSDPYGIAGTPDEARSICRVAEHLRCLAAEVEPSRMADGFEADRMRLLAHRLRQVAALMPDSDEARRLVETAIGAGMNLACHGDWSDEQRAVDRAHADSARAALLRALGVES